MGAPLFPGDTPDLSLPVKQQSLRIGTVVATQKTETEEEEEEDEDDL